MKVLKGIPLPAKRTGRSPGRRPKYPFADMEVGDCVAIELPPGGFRDSRPYKAALYHGRMYGKKFVGRRTAVDNTAHIWRVE